MLGVLGGSGLYEMPGLSGVTEQRVDTPYGAPSDVVVLGMLRGQRVAFLPRHGRGHRILPSEINYRANIYALKLLGATELLSVSAVGSLREDIAPGHLVVVDQFIDRTRRRESTFFGNGLVGHVALGHPVCSALAGRVADAADTAPVHRGGTYVCIEGPQFSTRAESFEYRALGASVIGMTNAPEYKLAREAQLCYSSLALSTDYDCWHDAHDSVTVDMVVATLRANVALAQRVVADVATGHNPDRLCSCRTSLKTAILTAPDSIDAQGRQRLEVLSR